MIAAVIALIHLLPIAAASFDSSPLYIIVILLGGFASLSGIVFGLVKFFDRKSEGDRAEWATIKDQSQQALNEVSIFRLSLAEERERRDRLERELKHARAELRKATESHSRSEAELIELHTRLLTLEQSLVSYMSVTNEISQKLLTNGRTDTFLHERWQRIMQENRVSAIQVDLDGKIVFVSDEAAKTLGYIPPELLGKSLIELMPEEDRPQYLSATLHVGEEPVLPFATGMLRKDGSEVRVMLALGKHRSSVTLIINTIDPEFHVEPDALDHLKHEQHKLTPIVDPEDTELPPEGS